MNFFWKHIRGLWNDQSGVSSVEYALLLSFVASAVIIGGWKLSASVGGEMSEAADCLDGSVKC